MDVSDVVSIVLVVVFDWLRDCGTSVAVVDVCASMMANCVVGIPWPCLLVVFGLKLVPVTGLGEGLPVMNKAV